MLVSLLKTFSVLIFGTLSGYIFKKICRDNNWISHDNIKKLAIFLQKLGMIWLMSITYVGSLWTFQIDSIFEIITLPLVGGLTTITGGALAVILAKYRNYDRIDTGSLFSCGFFANTVSLGGMICFFYLGEAGYAFVPINTFLMRLLYYGIGYPIAKMYGSNNKQKEHTLNKLIEILKDPFFNVGVASVIVGLILSASPLSRPEIYGTINEILIPMSTFILLFSVGLNLRFSRVNNFIAECLFISTIKFVAVPLITMIIALLLDYQHLGNGLPLKVSLIMASMPVAFNSVIAANIYDLNIDMVNACWIFTTIATIFILPPLLMFLNLF